MKVTNRAQFELKYEVFCVENKGNVIFLVEGGPSVGSCAVWVLILDFEFHKIAPLVG